MLAARHHTHKHTHTHTQTHTQPEQDEVVHSLASSVGVSYSW